MQRRGLRPAACTANCARPKGTMVLTAASASSFSSGCGLGFSQNCFLGCRAKRALSHFSEPSSLWGLQVRTLDREWPKLETGIRFWSHLVPSVEGPQGGFDQQFQETPYAEDCPSLIHGDEGAAMTPCQPLAKEGRRKACHACKEARSWLGTHLSDNQNPV